VGGPSAVRAFTFAISALRAWTPARTSASSRAFQIFSNSDSTWRSSSSAGGSTETFSRRMSFLTHQSGSYDSSRSGRGFPAPGRFSKAPSSWACRICSSNQDSQLTPGGLRSVMSPPTRRGSPLPTSACWSDQSRDEDELAGILRSVRCATEVGVDMLDREAGARQQVLGLESEDAPHLEAVDEALLAAVGMRHVIDKLTGVDLLDQVALEEPVPPDDGAPVRQGERRLLVSLITDGRFGEAMDGGDEDSACAQARGQIIEDEVLGAGDDHGGGSKASP